MSDASSGGNPGRRIVTPIGRSYEKVPTGTGMTLPSVSLSSGRDSATATSPAPSVMGVVNSSVDRSMTSTSVPSCVPTRTVVPGAMDLAATLTRTRVPPSTGPWFGLSVTVFPASGSSASRPAGKRASGPPTSTSRTSTGPADSVGRVKVKVSSSTAWSAVPSCPAPSTTRFTPVRPWPCTVTVPPPSVETVDGVKDVMTGARAPLFAVRKEVRSGNSSAPPR
ncbi:hypothetical protein COSO111634_23475 [Corallococcus soli]